MMEDKMTAEEKLNKARIKLQGRSPFFSYLSFFLTFKEDKVGILQGDGMGVSARGDVLYSAKFVDKLSDEQLMGVLCHEILHLALLQLVRLGNRNMEGWNIATDLCINSMLNKPREGEYRADWELPANCLLPDSGDCFKIGKVKIENISEKTAEQIFDELPFEESENGQGQGGKNTKKSKSGDGNGGKGFDRHIYGDKDGKKMSEAEKNEQENDWLNRIEEAYVSAKQKGNVPAGIERYIGELRKAEVSWRVLLQKFVTAEIPNDFTWNRKSKKSMATGYYLPDTTKEKIEVVVAIDTSGSIGKEELTEFIGEIIGMSKAYSQRINMKLLTHDCEIHDNYDVRNGSIDKIKQLKIRGGGGTSHKPIFDFVRDKIRNAKVLICFTDGESDLEGIDFGKYHFKKIFIISKGGTDEELKGKDCHAIKLKGDLR